MPNSNVISILVIKEHFKAFAI